jgi:hypothetical protein
MLAVNNLGGIGKLIVGNIPNPQGPIPEHDRTRRLAEAAARSFSPDALGEGRTCRSGIQRKGPQVPGHATWLPSHAYAAGTGTVIVDSNNNIQWVVTSGTSRTALQGHPNWSAAVFGLTADSTVRWRNLGSIATASTAAAGGTGGIIIDNTSGRALWPALPRCTLRRKAVRSADPPARVVAPYRHRNRH